MFERSEFLSPSERVKAEAVKKSRGAPFFSYLSWVSKKGKKGVVILLRSEHRKIPLKKARGALLWFLCFRKQGRDINELIYAFVKKIDLSNLLFIM